MEVPPFEPATSGTHSAGSASTKWGTSPSKVANSSPQRAPPLNRRIESDDDNVGFGCEGDAAG